VYRDRKELLNQDSRLRTELKYRFDNIDKVRKEIARKEELLSKIKDNTDKNVLAKVMRIVEKLAKQALNLLIADTYDITSYKDTLQKDIDGLNDQLRTLQEGKPLNVKFRAKRDDKKQLSELSVDKLKARQEKVVSKISEADAALAETKSTEGKVKDKLVKIDEAKEELDTLTEKKSKLEDITAKAKKKKAELLDITAEDSSVAKSTLKNALGTGKAAVKNSQSTAEKPMTDVSIDPTVVLEVSDKPSTLLSSMTISDIGNKNVTDLLERGTKMLDNLLDTSIRGAALSDSPAYALLRTADDKWNENAVVALMLAAEGSMGVNLGSWFMNDYVAISQMLELPNSRMVTPRMRKVFRDSGKFKSVVAGEIGDNMLKYTGLKIKSTADVELAERLSQEMGQIGLLLMQQDGKISKMNETVITQEQYLKATDADYEQKAYSSDDIAKQRAIKIPMVRAKRKYKPEETLKIREDIEDILGLLGNDEPIKKGPSFKELNPQLAGKAPKGNAITDTPNQSREIMMKQWSQKHNVNLDALDNLMMIGYNEDASADVNRASNKKMVLQLMGHVSDEDLANMQLDTYESTVASNSELESEYNNIVEMYDLVKSGRVSPEVWYEWFFTRNGRFTLDSAGVNSQTNKNLDRWLVVPEEHTQYINLKNKKTSEAWNYAISQAFGMGTDKTSNAKVIEFGKKVSNIKASDLLKKINEGKKEFIIDGVEIKIDHLGHALQAVNALKAKEDANGKGFTTTLSAEYDGITNGFINKAMQMPITKAAQLKETLGAGGINTGIDDGDKIVEQGQSFEDGSITDVYTQLAKAIETGSADVQKVFSDVIIGINSSLASDTAKKKKIAQVLKYKEAYEAVQELVPRKNDNGSISGTLRNLFKPVVMTFGYASSLPSIKRALGYNIAGSILDEVMKYDGTEDTASSKKAMDYLISVIKWESNSEVTNRKGEVQKIVGRDYKSLQELLRNKSADNIYTNNGMSLLSLLQETMSMGIGNQVEVEMNNRYGEIITANNTINSSFKMMFRLYKIKFEERLKELTDKVTEHNSKIGGDESKRIYISASNIKQITKDLKELFPMIQAPLSDNLDSSMVINDSRKVLVEDGRYPKASTHIKPGVFGDKKLQMSITNMLRELDESQAAGAVIPLHFIDGTEMGLTIQEVKGILGVHDAAVVGLDAAIEGPRAYNKNFYEVNSRFSMVRELLNSFARLAANDEYGKQRLSNRELGSVAPIERHTGAGTENLSFSDIAKELLELDVTVEEARVKLYSKGMAVQQMPGVSGVIYIAKPKNGFKESTARTNDVKVLEKRMAQGQAVKSQVMAEQEEKAKEAAKEKAKTELLDISQAKNILDLDKSVTVGTTTFPSVKVAMQAITITKKATTGGVPVADRAKQVLELGTESKISLGQKLAGTLTPDARRSQLVHTLTSYYEKHRGLREALLATGEQPLKFGNDLDIGPALMTVRGILNGKYVHVKSPKGPGIKDGQGSAEGDSKDKAMRSVSSTSIVELSPRRSTSSSKTTQNALPWVSAKSVNGTVMLARNKELAGAPLTEETKSRIGEAHQNGAKFVVGDMPGVDSQFITYLKSIGAQYKVYYTGPVPRILPSVPSKQYTKPGKHTTVKSGAYNTKNSANAKMKEAIIKNTEKAIETAPPALRSVLKTALKDANTKCGE